MKPKPRLERLPNDTPAMSGRARDRGQPLANATANRTTVCGKRGWPVGSSGADRRGRGPGRAAEARSGMRVPPAPRREATGRSTVKLRAGRPRKQENGRRAPGTLVNVFPIWPRSHTKFGDPVRRRRPTTTWLCARQTGRRIVGVPSATSIS